VHRLSPTTLASPLAWAHITPRTPLTSAAAEAEKSSLHRARIHGGDTDATEEKCEALIAQGWTTATYQHLIDQAVTRSLPRPTAPVDPCEAAETRSRVYGSFATHVPALLDAWTELPLQVSADWLAAFTLVRPGEDPSPVINPPSSTRWWTSPGDLTDIPLYWKPVGPHGPLAWLSNMARSDALDRYQHEGLNAQPLLTMIALATPQVFTRSVPPAVL
jgi:hypothetical protein